MVPDNSNAPTEAETSQVPDEVLTSQVMAKRLVFQPKRHLRESKVLLLLKKIPLLSGLLKNIEDITNHFSNIAQWQGYMSPGLQDAMKGFNFAGLALDIINFIRIPLIYLAFAINGEKPPITLSRNARWLYAAAIVGLSIAAIAAPVTAPIIAIVIASLGLIYSVVTLFKTLSAPYFIRKEITSIDNVIEQETKHLKELQSQTSSLEQQLSQTTEKEKLTAQLAAIRDQFDKEFQLKQERLQALYDRKLQCADHLEELKKEGKMHVVDRGLAVALSSLSLIGSSLTFLLPPLGFALIAGSAFIALSYFVGRIIAPKIKEWWAKKSSKSEATETAETPEATSELTLSEKPTPQSKLEATSDLAFHEKPTPQSMTSAMKLMDVKEGPKTDLKPSDSEHSHGGRMYGGTRGTVPIPEESEREGDSDSPHSKSGSH